MKSPMTAPAGYTPLTGPPRKPERWDGYPTAELLASGHLVRVTCACDFDSQIVEPEKVGEPCPLCQVETELLKEVADAGAGL